MRKHKGKYQESTRRHTRVKEVFSNMEDHEEHDNSPENSGESPTSDMFNDMKTTSTSSTLKRRLVDFSVEHTQKHN